MKLKSADWILYLVTFLLVFFGVILIYSITFSGEATRNFALQQVFTAIVGFIFLILLTFLDYRLLRSSAFLIYIVAFLLLLLLLTPLGQTYLGATRWLNLGIIQFQPSEFFKIVSIIILARICDKEELGPKNFLAALAVLFLPIFFVIKQPDFGTAMILFLSGMMIIFMAGFKKKYLYFLIALFVLIGVVLSLSVWNVKPFNNLLKDYQKKRVLTFFDAQKDPFGSGYNVSQSMITIGSGGILGRGLGFGPQSQLNFIPSKETDFVFAVAAEGFGFVGASMIVVLFFILFLRILRIARLAKDNFGTLLCVGIMSLFAFEVLINIGMTMGIMPVTGIPLPLISFGRTSLLTSLIAIGIAQSVLVRHKKITF